MYADRAPVPNCPAPRVLVLEESDKPYPPLTILEAAIEAGATSEDREGGPDDFLYWLVFPENPKRVDPFTERALRLLR